MATRTLKTLLAASIGLLALAIVINNLTDCNANFKYIRLSCS